VHKDSQVQTESVVQKDEEVHISNHSRKKLLPFEANKKTATCGNIVIAVHHFLDSEFGPET